MELYLPLVIVFALAYALCKVAVFGTRATPTGSWVWSSETARALQFLVWGVVVIWLLLRYRGAL